MHKKLASHIDDLVGLHSPRRSNAFTGRLIAATVVTLSSSLAMAQQASSSASQELQLEEVVVTAEKVTRSLQETATSIAVFTEEDLANSPGLDSTDDLFNRIANVATQGSKSGLLPAVRGVDGTGASQGGQQAVGGSRTRLAIQLDGRPLSTLESIYGAHGLWDVQQIEVLRGPQSTLQGRNAIGGTVAIRTKDPTFDWEGAVRLIGGNYDDRQGSFYASGPLIDEQLAFRVAYDRHEYDSFVSTLPPPPRYPGAGDPDSYRLETARAKLLIQPSALEGFRTVVTLNQTEFVGLQADGIVNFPFDEHVHVRIDPFFGQNERFRPRTTSGIVDTSWELNERFTFENTLAYSENKTTRYANPGNGTWIKEGHDMVVEPRLRFVSASGRWSALLGVHHFQDRSDEAYDIAFYVGPAGILSFEDSTTNTAAFAQLDYELSERFEVTVGGRLEREKRERFGSSVLDVDPDEAYEIDLDETYDSFLPKLGAAWHVNDDLTLGVAVSRAYSGGGAGFTFVPPFVIYTYEPEYAWTYEAYGRSQLIADRLFLTGNLFYSDYEDYQLFFDQNPDPDLFSFIVDNGTVETYGAELGLRWLAAPGLTVSADAGFLRTEIVDYTGEAIDGNELPRAPRLSGRLAAAYVHPAGFDLGADASYSDSYFDDVTNPAGGRSQAYWIANVQAGYTWGSVRLFGSVENVFDENAYLSAFIPSRGDTTAFILHPRAYRVGFTASFGTQR